MPPPTAFTPESVRRRVTGMKQILLMIAVVALVGCGENRAASEWKEEKEARAKAAAAETNAAPDIPPPPDKVGKIVNVDPKYGFIIINRGSAHGFKVGDKFNVFRNNKLIGRIEVTFLSKTNTHLSIAQPSVGLGVPAGTQFRAGDDLVIVN